MATTKLYIKIIKKKNDNPGVGIEGTQREKKKEEKEKEKVKQTAAVQLATHHQPSSVSFH
jgi:hypothetical protein